MRRTEVEFAMTIREIVTVDDPASLDAVVLQFVEKARALGASLAVPEELRKRLAPETVHALGPQPDNGGSRSAMSDAGAAVRRQMHRLVLEQSVAVLQACGGDTREAAARLGIKRQSLYDRLRRAETLRMIGEWRMPRVGRSSAA